MTWMAGPPAPVSGDDAQRAAREELRRVMYHRDDPSVIDRALNWTTDRLGHLVDGSVSGSALLLAILMIATLIIFAIVRAGRPRRTERLAGLTDPLASDAQVDHRRRAEELTAQGRLAEALREWLRAAIRVIEDRGILDPRPGRTGSDIAREAGWALPDAASQLRAATAAFDQVWFGERPATAADVAAGQAAADATREARLRPVDPAAAGYAAPR